MEQALDELFYEEHEVKASELCDEGMSNERDWLVPLWQNEARMYSLEQAQQLWHLFFRRSNARKRLDLNDDETKDVR